jgi:DMSO/TMAO reductase YedYZ heme-binding membrane subunit
MNDKKFLGAFLAATALTVAGCALYLYSAGNTDDNIRLLLRLTARISFVLLLAIFVARPLRDLFKTSFTQSLLRNRPLIGVTFAGIHTGHLAVLIYRGQFNPEFDFTISGNLVGSLLYVAIFAMLITTFSGPRRAIGPKAWKILHKLGLYFISFGFVQTQLPRAIDDWSNVNWWLMSIIIAALVIRLTAFFAKRSRKPIRDER